VTVEAAPAMAAIRALVVHDGDGERVIAEYSCLPADSPIVAAQPWMFIPAGSSSIEKAAALRALRDRPLGIQAPPAGERWIGRVRPRRTFYVPDSGRIVRRRETFDARDPFVLEWLAEFELVESRPSSG